MFMFTRFSSSFEHCSQRTKISLHYSFPHYSRKSHTTETPRATSRDNSRRIALQELLEVAELQRNLDQALQALLRGLAQLRLALVRRDVALDVHAHRRALAARPAQTEHDARAVDEAHDLALVLRHAVVDRVRVIEVVHVLDDERLARRRGRVRRAREVARRDVRVQLVDELVRALGRDLLIVVPREERAAVYGVVLLQELVDAEQLVRRLLVRVREDVQPCCASTSGCGPYLRRRRHAPTIAHTPSFSRMWSEPVPNDSSPQIERRPASMRLPKNFQPMPLVSMARVQTCTDDLTRRDDMALETLLLGDVVDLRTGRHATRKTLHATLLEVWDRLPCPVCDDRDAVTWRHECALAVDHVPVAVSVARRAERDVVALHVLDQFVRIRQVRVGVSATEVG